MNDHGTPDHGAPDHGNPGRGDISLVGILNVLWRRRLIVLGLPALGLLVGALYGLFGTRRWSATATIRPGITAFDPQGGPRREWQLKDITRWYDMMMYRRGLIERLDLPRDARPVIRAEFVAQGLQNLQGGNVITLWTTGTSPEMAAAVIDSSLAVFSHYVEADTVSSQLKLTRDGLRLQIVRLRNELTAVDRKKASIALQLEQARAESLTVVAQDLEYDLRLDQKRALQTYLERRLTDLREQEPELRQDLTQLGHLIRRASAEGLQAVSLDSIPRWARRDAVLDGGDVLESLTRAKLELQRALDDNRARQDSTALAAEQATFEAARLEIERESTIRQQLQDVRRKIGDLELERDFALPSMRGDLNNQIAERRVKLDLIAPVERVGETVVSDRPVRPRTLRATAILTFLGLVAGLVLAFVWDFVARHRREIMRS